MNITRRHGRRNPIALSCHERYHHDLRLRACSTRSYKAPARTACKGTRRKEPCRFPWSSSSHPELSMHSIRTPLKLPHPCSSPYPKSATSSSPTFLSTHKGCLLGVGSRTREDMIDFYGKRKMLILLKKLVAIVAVLRLRGECAKSTASNPCEARQPAAKASRFASAEELR